MLFDIGIFYSVTAALGLTIVALVQAITPIFATSILNFGSPIGYLIEIIVTLPIIKKIQPALNYYSKTVLVQTPVLVWSFNIFLFFRIFLSINYTNPTIKVPAPVHILNGLLYIIIIVLFTQVTAKFYRYKNLTISQSAELTNLQAYTSHIETMYDDLRRFRHDYKNVLLSLEGAVSSGNIKEVQDIFQRVVKPTNTNLDDQTAVLSHLENIENIEIKSLVYNKVMTAINDHIDVSVEVVEPFKISPKVKITDAVRIIAILFDNAINAAKKAPTKEINFSLFTKGSAQYIVIRNSTTEEKIDLHMLDGNFKGISSGKHSLGLRNLRIILASYPFIQHNSQSANHSVTQEIIIH
ncbi:GHKL domain-containing protein [Limosilactobacillus reuteri]